MGDKQRDITPTEDGRPAEVREGEEPASDDSVEEDIPDESAGGSVTGVRGLLGGFAVTVTAPGPLT